MPRIRRIKPTRTRIDQILEDSRLLRTQAQALNEREQLWELHGVLRQRAAEDVMMCWSADQRSERIGSSLAARRAGM